MENHKRKMLKHISGAGTVLAALFLLAIATPAPLRLHIIANSDSAFDQQTKLEVRDAVLTSMNDELAGAKGRADARQLILDHGSVIQTAAETALEQADANYGAQLSLGWTEFPTRTYGAKTYAAGSYEALRIVLGDGGGQNWWCVMYPPLCLGDLQGDTDTKVTFKSAILEAVQGG